MAELRRLREVEKQFKRLQMEHDLLKKAIRFASQRKAEIFAFIAANRQTYPIQMMCALYRRDARGLLRLASVASPASDRSRMRGCSSRCAMCTSAAAASTAARV